MISLHAVFWLLLLFFAGVGAIRGWVREILVTVALVLALFILSVFPYFRETEPSVWIDEQTGDWAFVVPWRLIDPQAGPEDKTWPKEIASYSDGQNALRAAFLARVGVFLVLAFFGYETSGLGRFAARLGGTRPQERILGLFLGALNGYLLVGSLWYYVAAYGYPLEAFESPLQHNLPEPYILRYMAPVFLPLKAFGVPVALLVLVMLLVFVLIALL